MTATLKRWNKTLTVEPEALEKLVTDGYSLAYGARFLKRVIDDRIKLPLSQQWKEANSFRATLRDGQIVVEAVGPRLVAASAIRTRSRSAIEVAGRASHARASRTAAVERRVVTHCARRLTVRRTP